MTQFGTEEAVIYVSDKKIEHYDIAADSVIQSYDLDILDHSYWNIYEITPGGIYMIIDNFQYTNHKIGKYDYLLNTLTMGGDLPVNFPADSTTNTSSNYILYGFGFNSPSFYVYDHTSMNQMGIGYGGNTHDINCPSFAPNNIYVVDNTGPVLKMYDNTLFAETKSTAISDPFKNMAEVPGMKLFLFKSGDTSVKRFEFVDQELNVITPVGYNLPSMTADQNMLVAVDPNYPYMAVSDPLIASGQKVKILNFQDLCSLDCGTGGCTAYPTASV